MSPWLRVRQHADRLLALLLGVLTAPVVAICAVAVRRHDGGPPLITVERIGRGGRPFPMWKIRSMRAEAPGGRAGGVTLTAEGDDRITPVGRHLRTLHLDELPQLWNVVAGDMTLLGPRPEAPDWVEHDDPRWRAVLAVAPGMAGPTQLVVDDWERERISASPDGSAYRSEVLPVKLAIDAWYVAEASPLHDLRVAAALGGRVLPSAVRSVVGDPAAALVARVLREVPAARPVGRWRSDTAPAP